MLALLLAEERTEVNQDQERPKARIADAVRERGGEDHQPVVFINACASAAMSPERLLSLIDEFFLYGAGGAVGLVAGQAERRARAKRGLID